MKKLLFIVAFLSQISAPAFALEVFNLNAFDQLQGNWDAGFRTRRLNAVADYVKGFSPDLVIFQEARGNDGAASLTSVDAANFGAYTFQHYIHEMMGADDASYGYWMGAKTHPRAWIDEAFSFPGGVARRMQVAVWDTILGGKCLGVVSLHLSYQTTDVRQREARWLLSWLRAQEMQCSRWLVVGDFNADFPDKEMQILAEGGLKSLYAEKKPTVGAYNPIRRIYGETIPSLTIDWALGWNLQGTAEVVLDTPYQGEWVSDHAAVRIHLPDEQ